MLVLSPATSPDDYYHYTVLDDRYGFLKLPSYLSLRILFSSENKGMKT